MADFHVLPLNDAIEHQDQRSCWCQPTIEEVEANAIVIHHSADGREVLEEDALPPATRH